MTPRAVEDDFQHFLTYSQLRSQPAEAIELMRKAFNAAHPLNDRKRA